MLTVLETRNENAQAQRKIEKAFKRFADKTEKLSIGWQGGSLQTPVSWSDELKIWWAFLDDRDGIKRYWRAFGTVEPRWRTAASHYIPCEINSPFKGTSRRVAGAFARDEWGELFLVHRGNIGGGRKGIGKSLFIDHTQSERCIIADARGQVDVSLVGALSSERFCEQVAEFVRDVARIKAYASSAEDKKTRMYYSPEFRGSKEYEVRRNMVVACDHGLIVDAMRKQLDQHGLKVGNDRNRDLFIISPHQDRIRVLIEFKTDSSSSSVYSAIGQLLFNSVRLPHRPQLVAVFPNTLPQSAVDRLKSIGIHCIRYEWKKSQPKFDSLKAIL